MLSSFRIEVFGTPRGVIYRADSQNTQGSVLVVRPGAPSSVLAPIVVRPGALSSVLAPIVVRPGAPSSVLAPIAVRPGTLKNCQLCTPLAPSSGSRLLDGSSHAPSLALATEG